jgi:hypothetical protein
MLKYCLRRIVMKEKDYGFFGVLKTETLDEILGDAELGSEDYIFAAAEGSNPKQTL